MESKDFSYDVSREVILTGRDLFLMQESCLMHYDFKTSAIFKQGGFGYGWRNRFAWNVEPENNEPDIETILKRHPDGTIDLTLSPDQIDALMKGLEMSHHLPEDDAGAALSLKIALKRVFLDIQDEWKRLNYTPYEIDVLDEQTFRGRKVFIVAKGAARVDHKVIHEGVTYEVIEFGVRSEDHTALVVKPLSDEPVGRL